MIEQVLEDLEFMKKIDWYCGKREEYETIKKEQEFDRFEILDFE